MARFRLRWRWTLALIWLILSPQTARMFEPEDKQDILEEFDRKQRRFRGTRASRFSEWCPGLW